MIFQGNERETGSEGHILGMVNSWFGWITVYSSWSNVSKFLKQYIEDRLWRVLAFSLREFGLLKVF